MSVIPKTTGQARTAEYNAMRDAKQSICCAYSQNELLYLLASPLVPTCKTVMCPCCLQSQFSTNLWTLVHISSNNYHQTKSLFSTTIFADLSGTEHNSFHHSIVSFYMLSWLALGFNFSSWIYNLFNKYAVYLWLSWFL